MSRQTKFTRRPVNRQSNSYNNIITAMLKGKSAEDDMSVPLLRAEDLVRDKTQNYVLQ